MESQSNNNYISPLPPLRPLPDPTQTPSQMHDNKQDIFRQPSESRKHALPSPDRATNDIFDRLDRPFKLSLGPPPSYSQARSTTSLSFSLPETTELAPIKSTRERSENTGNGNVIKHNANNQTLPPLSSITAPSPAPSEETYKPPAPPPVTHWPSLNPLTAYYNPSHVQDPEPPMQMDVDTNSSVGRSIMSSASPDRFQGGRASSVSLDDPDVRMAAEALGDLRAGQFSLAS